MLVETLNPAQSINLPVYMSTKYLNKPVGAGDLPSAYSWGFSMAPPDLGGELWRIGAKSKDQCQTLSSCKNLPIVERGKIEAFCSVSVDILTDRQSQRLTKDLGLHCNSRAGDQYIRYKYFVAEW